MLQQLVQQRNSDKGRKRRQLIRKAPRILGRVWQFINETQSVLCASTKKQWAIL